MDTWTAPIDSPHMRSTWSRTAAFILIAAVIAGCNNSGNPFTSVPVSGKLTFEDGTLIPVPGIKLFFHCLEPPKGNMHPRPAQVSVEADGTFKDITTYKFGDGLVLGKHSVTVVALENGRPSKKIPAEYAFPQKSPLVVEVTSSGQVLEIKVPKPKPTR
jgi:hypothetical protein